MNVLLVFLFSVNLRNVDYDCECVVITNCKLIVINTIQESAYEWLPETNINS